MKRYEGSPAVVIERRKGTPDSPFSNMNETLVVTGDGKVLLSEIPNELNRVIVTSEDNATWYEIKDGKIPENGFKVDYINKLVTFNTVHVGKQLHFEYLGEGNHYYSVHSIYTKLEDESVVETLGDIVEGGKDALDALEALNEKLEEVTQATNNAVAATTEANNMVLEGNQVIDVANNKITEIDTKITEATSKISELDLELDDARNIISDVKQQSAIVEDIITDGQNTIENANLVINEIKSVGKFNLTTFYKKNNTVLDNGSTWIALQDTQDNPLPTLPITENSNWRLASLHGAKGEKGDTGAALSILGKLTDVSQLPPTGHSGDAYTINGELYVWSDNGNAWENVGNIKGEKGDKGTIGDEGKSAYEVAIINGFVGTEVEWLATLKGEKGDTPDLSDINDQISEIQQIIEQGGYENIDPLEATNLPADYPLGESFFTNTHPNIASWQTALNVDATFTRLFVITRIDKNRLHAFQDIIIASGEETKRFTRYNLNDVWLDARESGGGGGEWDGKDIKMFSPYHGVVRFNDLNPWTLPALSPETIIFEFVDIPKTAFNGRFTMRVFMESTATEPGGYMEHQITAYDNPTHATALYNVDYGQMYLSPTMAENMYAGGGISRRPDTGYQSWLLVKIGQQRKISVEIEYISPDDNVEEILKSVNTRHDTTIYTTWTAAKQVSLFESTKTSVQYTNGGLYHVNPVTGNDSTAVIGDATRPWKTINGALRAVPKYLNSNVLIELANGTYSDAIQISGMIGHGTLTIRCINFYQAITLGITVDDCTARIDFQGLRINANNYVGIMAINSSFVNVMSCTIDSANTSIVPYEGVLSDNSNVFVSASTFSYRASAMTARNFGNLLSDTNSGANNSRVFSAITGGTIAKRSTQPTGSASDFTESGGQIR